MTQLSLEQAMHLALQHHRAGNLTQAEAIYRKALAINPNSADIHFNLGLLLVQPGRLHDAANAFRKAILLNTNHAQAHAYLGSILHELGQLDEALAACTRAAQLNSNFAEVFVEIGNICSNLNRLEDSVAAHRQAIRIKPRLATAHSNLADVLRRMGHLDEALAACKHAIELQPDIAQSHINLGIILREKKDFDAALAAYARAIQLNPNSAKAYNNMGNALLDLERTDEALDAFDRAVVLNPNSPEFHSNRGLVLTNLGRIEEAVAAYRKSLLLNPNDSATHWSLALSLLTTGSFAQGWEEYDWGIRGTRKFLGLKFISPQWNGEDPCDRTLLLHDEGGYGDALHFVRYSALLHRLGARIILQCKPALISLFAELPGIEAVVAEGRNVPHYDFHVSLQSLPRLFKTDLTNIPNTVPYLKVPAKHQECWRPRMRCNGLKVGLVWSGASHGRLPPKRQLRSADLFVALSQVNGVQYFSLQKGEAAKEPRPPDFNMIDFSDELSDFADTAAVVEQLDLVITIDTSVVHLTGALARPVWVLLSQNADFRWLLNRADSPWYPTARLFRQTAAGDFSGPISDIVAALKHGHFAPTPTVP